jgi:hypothetical protein
MLTVLLLTLWIPAVQAAQTPARPQTTPRDARPVEKKGTAVIRGRVTSADTGKPVRRVQIRATAPDLSEPRTIATDRDGRYQIKDLPAGRYTINVTRSGYLSMSYGQRRPREQGRPLQLADGQVADKIDFALPRMGIITGRLTDETGEAIAGVNVFAMEIRFFEGKRRLWLVGLGDRTDDTGEYRILSLTPGEYYVLAATRETWTEGDGSELLAYAPTYFPGTTIPRDAQRVKVGPGQRIAAIDFGLAPGRAASASGTALSSRGAPLAGETVQVGQSYRGPNSTMMMSVAAPKVGPDGSFTIRNLPPGEYQVQVRKPADREAPAETVSYTLVMTGSDVEGIALVTTAGFGVSGHVTTDTGEPPGFAPSRIRLVARAVDPDLSRSGGIDPDSGRVREDWTFQISSLFGRQRLRVGGLPEGWAVRSMQYVGREIIDEPVEPEGALDLAGVQVVLTDKITALSGSVRSDRGEALPDCTVLVFPAESALWGEESRFVRALRPDQSGTFEVKGLPPAEYLAVALDYVADGDWNDPAYLETLRDGATAFTLREGEEKQIALKLKK